MYFEFMFQAFLLYTIIDTSLDKMLDTITFNFEAPHLFPSMLEIKQALAIVLKERRGTLIDSMNNIGIYAIADSVREKLGLDELYRDRMSIIVNDIIGNLFKSLKFPSSYKSVDFSGDYRD